MDEGDRLPFLVDSKPFAHWRGFAGFPLMDKAEKYKRPYQLRTLSQYDSRK